MSLRRPCWGCNKSAIELCNDGEYTCCNTWLLPESASTPNWNIIEIHALLCRVAVAIFRMMCLSEQPTNEKRAARTSDCWATFWTSAGIPFLRKLFSVSRF